MPSLPIEVGQGLRRSKTPPPRRSSLQRKSLESAPAKRAPIPSEFLQANDPVMAPISEQSEVGSPASTRAARNAEVEMSPASVNASPAGAGRMSMSERYRLQGLTVPAPLALSSSLTSPLLGSMAEPRSARSPLPVAFSHARSRLRDLLRSLVRTDVRERRSSRVLFKTVLLACKDHIAPILVAYHSRVVSPLRTR